MEPANLSAVLGLGFVLGLLHAFDADHLVAVSALASRQRQWRHSLLYAARWALGHGTILLLVAGGALFFRFHLSASVGPAAERAVGVILILSGLSIARHVLAGTPAAGQDGGERHRHAPLLVGLVHGLAGSAPALALIPATLYLDRPALALGYLLLFSLGALCAMALFGLVLGRCQQSLLNHSPRFFDASRLLLALTAAGLGLFWLGAA